MGQSNIRRFWVDLWTHIPDLQSPHPYTAFQTFPLTAAAEVASKRWELLTPLVKKFPEFYIQIENGKHKREMAFLLRDLLSPRGKIKWEMCVTNVSKETILLDISWLWIEGKEIRFSLPKVKSELHNWNELIILQSVVACYKLLWDWNKISFGQRKQVQSDP